MGIKNITHKAKHSKSSKSSVYCNIRKGANAHIISPNSPASKTIGMWFDFFEDRSTRDDNACFPFFSVRVNFKDFSSMFPTNTATKIAELNAGEVLNNEIWVNYDDVFSSTELSLTQILTQAYEWAETQTNLKGVNMTTGTSDL